MTKLHEIKCVACEGGVPPLTRQEIDESLAKVSDWRLEESGRIIYRKFSFKNFYETMAFLNVIAWIANQEGHHPDIEAGYNYCTLKFTTHAINALTQNDFICAAKIDYLLKMA